MLKWIVIASLVIVGSLAAPRMAAASCPDGTYQAVYNALHDYGAAAADAAPLREVPVGLV